MYLGHIVGDGRLAVPPTVSNLALLFPALSDSPGRFLLFFQYNLYPLEREDAKQSQRLNSK